MPVVLPLGMGDGDETLGLGGGRVGGGLARARAITSTCIQGEGGRRASGGVGNREGRKQGMRWQAGSQLISKEEWGGG